jgi:hypothetical protein
MSHREPEECMDPKAPGVFDIGHGVLFEYYEAYGRPELGRIGIQFEHPDGKGGRCWGGVPFKDANPADPKGWVVESREPLTLSPSILCLTCGFHGFIRGGKWVPA